MNLNKYFLLIALVIVSLNFNCFSSDIGDPKETAESLHESITAYQKFKLYKNNFQSQKMDDRENLLNEMEAEFLPKINQIDDKSLYNSVNDWIKAQKKFLYSRSLVRVALSAGSSDVAK